MKKITTIANAFSSISFFAAGMGILGYALHEFASLTEGKVITLFAYSIVMFLMAFRDSLSGFSVFGLKAELREKISEADVVIQDLRNLAKLLLSPTVTTVASMGRWGSGFSFKEKHDFKINVEEAMRSLKFSEEEIENIFPEGEWHKYILGDIVRQASQPVLELIKQKIKERNGKNKQLSEAESYCEKYQNFFKEYVCKDDSIFNSYQIFIREIEACTILTDEEKKQLCVETPALLDLKYYCQHKNFREPEKLPIGI